MVYPSHDWFMQFVGVFLADGCVSFNFRQKSDPRPRPQLTINLRADDRPFLDEVCERLGGNVMEYDPMTTVRSKRQARWVLTGYKQVAPLVERMVRATEVNLSKAKQLRLMVEACQWRASWPNRLGGDGLAIAQDYVHQMSALKKYTPG